MPATSKETSLGSLLASLSAAFASGFGAWSLTTGDICLTSFFTILSAVGVFAAFEAGLQLRRKRSLAFELSTGQRGAVYEVVVTLNPRSALRLTGVTVTLRCVQTESTSNPAGPAHIAIFTLSETLFEGSTRLGHGEKFVRTASFGLPAKVRLKPASAGGERAIHCLVMVRVEVDGAACLEHEQLVTVVLERDYETLSQM